jgi:ketohexokinase
MAGMLYAAICRCNEWNLPRKLQFANELAGRKVLQEGFSGLGDAVKHYFESQEKKITR